MVVDGELGDPGAGGDLVHAGADEIVLGEHLPRGLQNGGALGHVLGTAGA